MLPGWTRAIALSATRAPSEWPITATGRPDASDTASIRAARSAPTSPACA